MSTDMDQPNLTCYRSHPFPGLPIVPAFSKRDWMDATPDHHAYRCLPLLIGNQHGWFLLNRHHISVIWNGKNGLEDLIVTCHSAPDEVPCPVKSHFGSGIVTWDLNYVFQTSPGFNLLVKGPSNWPKDGVAPLEAIIETDWNVTAFTMNWKVTRPDYSIEFMPGDPICMIVPIRRGDVESFSPRLCKLSDNAELQLAHERWARSRGQFMRELQDQNSEASARGWQKDYFRGLKPDGTKPREHQAKLDVKEFIPRTLT